MAEHISRLQRLQLAGSLASGIAHDLNNHLTLVLGHLEMAAIDIPRDAPVAETLDLARQAANHCATMSRRLVSIGRPTKPTTTRIDVTAALFEARDVLACIRPRFVEIEIDAEPDLALRGDPTLLQQVLINLGTNAFHAMPDGGKLQFRSWFDGFVKIAVTDDGCGIPASIRSRIFEPFFTTHPETGGSGLGLSTTRSIVIGFGGLIGCESAPGKGTQFIMSIPGTKQK